MPPQSNERSPGPVAGSGSPREPVALDRVRQALQDLHYGTVTIVVHDGTVVQIDRTEKLRLGRAGNGS